MATVVRKAGSRKSPAVQQAARKNRAASGGKMAGVRAESTPGPARAKKMAKVPPLNWRQSEQDVAVDGRDSYAVTAFGEILDRSLHAMMARATLGLSPAAVSEAYLDWANHLLFSPGKQLQLIHKAVRKTARVASFANAAGRAAIRGNSTECCIEPLPQDHRFDAEVWQKWPYSVIYQTFLHNQQWWHNATTGIRGVTKQHENIVEFGARQALDMFSPSNYLFTNPETLGYTLKHGGKNLVTGFRNLVEDASRALGGKKPVGTENFVVGKDIAVTPGKVIYRNRLVELIQYEPTTDKVRPEPVFIVPAWIMKYYILDLSPENSLVKYLTDQGYTVFILSWKNPGPEDRDIGMDDYRTLGVMSALDVINTVVPGEKVHAMGYCLGGTLLSIAASTMARDGDDRLQSITLLAAQTDFTEAGELMLFINESQLTFLEDMMWEQGYLDTNQMSGAFQMLRSKDLIWSRMVREYLMGERPSMIDLMAWNADGTRMPYRMHSEYLRYLFLNNDLAEGRFTVGGKPIVLSDIEAPTFAVGTVRDHVAPWRSVYKNSLIFDSDFTFLLTSGGHNAGIVAAPGSNRHSYQVMDRKAGEHYLDPETFVQDAATQAGSWWPEWVKWLDQRSGNPVAPPTMGVPELGLEPYMDAPGSYVLQE